MIVKSNLSTINSANFGGLELTKPVMLKKGGEHPKTSLSPFLRSPSERKATMTTFYILNTVCRIKNPYYFLICVGITLVRQAFDGLLEGHDFGVTVQISVRQPSYFLFELLLYFGRQIEHGLWLLRGNLQRLTQVRLISSVFPSFFSWLAQCMLL